MWTALLICMAFLTVFLVYKSRSSTRQDLKFAVLLSSVATLILCLVSALSNPEQKEEDQREAVYRSAVAMKLVASLPPRDKPWKILSFEAPGPNLGAAPGPNVGAGPNVAAAPGKKAAADLIFEAIKTALGKRGEITHRLVPMDLSPEGIRRVVFHVKPDLILMQVSLPQNPAEQEQLFLGGDEEGPPLPPLYLLNVNVRYVKKWLAGKQIAAAIVQKPKYDPRGVPDAKDPGVFDQRYLLINAGNFSAQGPEFFAPEVAPVSEE